MRTVCLLGGLLCAASGVASEPPIGRPQELVIGDRPVEVRSGPGKEYYVTGLLPSGSRVEVYRKEPGGWLAIRPPEGSFSLVRRSQLAASDEPGVARVVENDAVCRVGSSVVRAGYPVSHVKLRKGELVELQEDLDKTPERRGGWCRITPPAGEFRWISTKDVPTKTAWLDSLKESLAGLSPRPTPPPRTGSGVRPAGFQQPAEGTAPPPLLNADVPLDPPAGEGSSPAAKPAAGQAGKPDVLPPAGDAPKPPATKPSPGADKPRAEPPASPRKPAPPVDAPLITPPPEVPPTIVAPTPKLQPKPKPALPAPPAVAAAAPPVSKPVPAEKPEPVRVMPESAAFTAKPAPAQKPTPAAKTDPPQDSEGSKWTSRNRMPASELRRVEVELTRMVANDISTWRLGPLRQQLEGWGDKLESEADRARARVLLQRISDFEKLQDRFVQAAGGKLAPPEPLAATATPPAATAPPPATLNGGAVVRYDGQGWLVPVHSTRQAAPAYALLDNDGNVLQYVSPAPGVNLTRYLRKQVGIYGQRGYVQSMQKSHLTAERIIDLDRHLR